MWQGQEAGGGGRDPGGWFQPPPHLAQHFLVGGSLCFAKLQNGGSPLQLYAFPCDPFRIERVNGLAAGGGSTSSVSSTVENKHLGKIHF